MVNLNSPAVFATPEMNSGIPEFPDMVRPGGRFPDEMEY
jgi:hypothetical protein